MHPELSTKWPSSVLLWVATAVVAALLVVAIFANNLMITAGVLGVVASYAVFGAGWAIWAVRKSQRLPG
jgi:hypothetical protein